MALALLAGTAPAGLRRVPRLQPFPALGHELVAEHPSTFRLRAGTLHVSGYGNLWTLEPSYDVTAPGATCRVELEARLQLRTREDGSHEGAEAMVGFSANREGWNSGRSDALSFRIGCDPDDGFHDVVRSEMYAHFHALGNHDVVPGEWFRLTVTLGQDELVASVDGEEVLRKDLHALDFPRRGHVGLLGYRAVPWEVRALEIRSTHGPQEAPLEVEPTDSPDAGAGDADEVPPPTPPRVAPVEPAPRGWLGRSR